MTPSHAVNRALSSVSSIVTPTRTAVAHASAEVLLTLQDIATRLGANSPYLPRINLATRQLSFLTGIGFVLSSVKEFAKVGPEMQSTSSKVQTVFKAVGYFFLSLAGTMDSLQGLSELRRVSYKIPSRASDVASGLTVAGALILAGLSLYGKTPSENVSVSSNTKEKNDLNPSDKLASSKDAESTGETPPPPYEAPLSKAAIYSRVAQAGLIALSHAVIFTMKYSEKIASPNLQLALRVATTASPLVATWIAGEQGVLPCASFVGRITV